MSPEHKRILFRILGWPLAAAAILSVALIVSGLLQTIWIVMTVDTLPDPPKVLWAGLFLGVSAALCLGIPMFLIELLPTRRPTNG